MSAMAAINWRRLGLFRVLAVLVIAFAVAGQLGLLTRKGTIDPTVEQLNTINPSAGDRGEMRISAVIPQRTVAPPAVRVERRGTTADSAAFDLCLNAGSAGYRLGFFEPAPSQQLIRNAPGGGAVIASAGRQTEVLTRNCDGSGPQEPYSLRYSEAPASFDRPVTVMISPQ